MRILVKKKKKRQKWGSGVYVDNRIDFPDPRHSNTFVAWTIIEKAFLSESMPRKMMRLVINFILGFL